MALREYYAETIEDAAERQVDAITGHSVEERDEPAARAVQPPVTDKWALQYIGLTRLQPLLDALDINGSSFVTVNEVNIFTSARPQGWR